ncbi:MAG: SdrD B-like domain-containing protein [Patescibacteria group bacterium]
MVNHFLRLRRGRSVISSLSAFLTIISIVTSFSGPIPAHAFSDADAAVSSTDSSSVAPLSEVDVVPVSGSPSPGGGSGGYFTPIEPTVFVPPPVPAGKISGMVFEDIDGNHQFTPGEPGLPDWTVELYLFNPNADVAPIGTAMTDATGNYAFANLPVGIYIVREIGKPPRWIQTFPSGPLSADPWGTTVPPDVVPFPYAPIDPIPVSSIPAIGTIEPIPHNASSDALTIPATGTSPIGRDTYKVTLGLNQIIANLNFGNFAYAMVSGFSWHDLNADGIWQPSGVYPEPALPGWSVTATGGTTKNVATAPNGEYQFIFAPDELGSWFIQEHLPSDWRHTFPLNPATYTADIQTSGQGETNKNFGIVHFYDIVGIKFVPLSGDPAMTHETFALDTSSTLITSNGGQTLVTVSAGTQFTRSDAQPINVNAFSADSVALSSLSGFPGSVTPRAAIQWGLPGVETVMSAPVQFSLFVGSGFDGVTLGILRSTTGTGGWTSDGIGSPSACVVALGVCTFTATKASNFAAVETVQNPPPPPPPSGGNSGGGGTGNGSITTPIPPPPPGGSGTIPPPQQPNNPGLALVSFQSPVSQAPQTLREIDLLEGINADTELDLEAALEETETATETESETGSDNGGFLSATLNLLTLGTGNVLVGWIVALAILGAIYFIFRRRRDKEATGRSGK